MPITGKGGRGFLIQLAVSRIGEDGPSVTKTEDRTLDDRHLIGDKRLPSTTIVSSVMQMLYSMLESEKGFFKDPKSTLWAEWEAARKAEKEKAKNESPKTSDEEQSPEHG